MIFTHCDLLSLIFLCVKCKRKTVNGVLFAIVANIAKSDEGLEAKALRLVQYALCSLRSTISFLPSRIWISSNAAGGGGANSIEQQETAGEDAYLGQSEITNLHPNICSILS